MKEVKKFADRFFKKQAGYQPGDLISRSATTKLLKSLEAKGWQVRDKPELLKRVLADDSFLLSQFGDEKGREFLRKIQQYPKGIDRVDRMSQLPQGERSVNDLIRKVPNGAQWIEGMTETRVGRNLGERLSNARGVGDFNAPTGRIYTVPELVKEIHGRLEPAERPVSTDRRRSAQSSAS